MTRKLAAALAAILLPISGFAADLPPIVTEGIVNASPSEVWRAWTTPEGLRSWLAPVADIDLRIDGLVRTNYNPNGNLGDDGTIENRIIAFEPDHMLAMKVAKAPKSFPFPNAVQGMWTVVYLTGQGGRQTLVRTVGLGFTDDPESTRMRDFFQKGNDYTLSELRKRFDK
jgi:uncharacterized protein YndB with AHSA1/START domain